MANPETERELKRLNIDTNEEQLPVSQGGWRLRSRTITVKAPPVPPPRSSSAPLSVAHDPSDTTPGLDTTDAESIHTWLQFATEQMHRRHCITSDAPDTTSVASSSPTLQQEHEFSQHHTPSSHDDYMIPQNLDLHDSLYQHTTPPEKDMENPRNQCPDVMIGEAYYDF